MQKILIVDDSSFMTTIIEHILRDIAGYNDIMSVDNGDEAIRVCSSNKIDLVLLDIVIHGLNGVEVCKQIKQRFNCNIIICSACGKQNYVKECLEYGASSIITKPFKPEEVIEVVTKTIGKPKIDIKVESMQDKIDKYLKNGVD